MTVEDLIKILQGSLKEDPNKEESKKEEPKKEEPKKEEAKSDTPPKATDKVELTMAELLQLISATEPKKEPKKEVDHSGEIFI